MYINKELIKKTGYFMRNYMYLKPDMEDNAVTFYIRVIGEYMRNYAMLDYDTKQRLIGILKEFMREKDIVFEDEEMFVEEVIKHLPYKVWGDE